MTQQALINTSRKFFIDLICGLLNLLVLLWRTISNIRSSTVGFLTYAMVCSSPELSYVVDKVSRYIANLGKNNSIEY